MIIGIDKLGVCEMIFLKFLVDVIFFEVGWLRIGFWYDMVGYWIVLCYKVFSEY